MIIEQVEQIIIITLIIIIALIIIIIIIIYYHYHFIIIKQAEQRALQIQVRPEQVGLSIICTFVCFCAVGGNV